MGTKIVRVRPPSKRDPSCIDTHVVAGAKFVQGGGWYEVPDAIAAVLAETRVNEGDPNSSPAFDVCATKDAALALEEKLRAEDAEREAKATAPRVVQFSGISTGALTTADLPRPSTPGVLQPPPPAPPADGSGKRASARAKPE